MDVLHLDGSLLSSSYLGHLRIRRSDQGQRWRFVLLLNPKGTCWSEIKLCGKKQEGLFCTTFLEMTAYLISQGCRFFRGACSSCFCSGSRAPSPSSSCGTGASTTASPSSLPASRPFSTCSLSVSDARYEVDSGPACLLEKDQSKTRTEFFWSAPIPRTNLS